MSIGIFYKTPLSIRLFIGKALLLAIVWKFVYLIYLLPGRYIDQPLTSHVGANATFLLNHFSGMHHFTAINIVDSTIMEGQLQLSPVCKILHENKKVLHIADGCNGLELMVIYWGFIICFPKSSLYKIKFAIIGCLLIDIMNIFRCYFLGFLKECYHPLFYISHHFIFKAIIYASIVFLWIRFTNQKQPVYAKN